MSVRPAPDVAFVLVRNPDCEAVELYTPGFREVKDAFMTIVKKPLRIDWLEMTVRLQIALSIFNCNRLDPVNRVLQKKSA